MNRKQLTKILQNLRVVTFVAILLGSVTLAQALTVSPARLEVNGDPGVSTENEILLINEQDAEQTFYTSVENFEAQGESGTPNFTASKEGLASWVKITDKITLKKGERIKVPFSVAIPTNADPGGHFAAIFFSTVPPEAKDGGQVSVGAKVGMLVLLRVNGDFKEQAGLLSFNLKNKVHVLTSLPANFEYRFKNDGGDRVNPKGEITIRDTIGFKAASLDANKMIGNVLPNSTRKFDVRWGDEDALPASATFFDHVSFQTRNFALGLYFAKLNLQYGTSGNDSLSTVFLVLPWQLIIVIIVIAVIVLTLLRIGLKRYNKWIIKQARLAAKG